MASPRTSHWTAVERILRYLKGTMDFGMEFKPSISSQVFVDADWAPSNEDNR